MKYNLQKFTYECVKLLKISDNSLTFFASGCKMLFPCEKLILFDLPFSRLP